MTATELSWPRGSHRARDRRVRRRLSKPDHVAALHARAAARRGRAGRGRRRSSSTPAASPGVRPRTSSSSTSRPRGSHLVGRRQPAALGGALRRACARRSSHSSRRPMRSTSSTPWPAPTRRTGSACASSPRIPTTRSSRARCSSTQARGASGLFAPEAVVLHAPDLEADPAEDGTRTGTFVVLHPGRAEVLVGGTYYAGEIKKSIFTVMNDRLPLEGVFPMHCSANVGEDGHVAIFFGLSGTGKTTLSADAERSLIGDDEHGWGDSGVFNIEGGCYAKVIRLSPVAEPEIFRTTRTLRHDPRERHDRRARPPRPRRRLEDREHARRLQARADLPRASRKAGRPSELGRSSSPRTRSGSCRRSPGCRAQQALYYFLSGFTAKLAGTEIGVTEPQPTFSTCFAQPFLPQPPAVYARMLGEKLDAHAADVWLVNTGWTGGPVRRGPADADPGDAHDAARRAVRQARARRVAHRRGLRLRGAGAGAGRRPEAARPALDVARPGAYDRKARELAAMFVENFARRFGDVDESIRAAGPTDVPDAAPADLEAALRDPADARAGVGAGRPRA